MRWCGAHFFLLLAVQAASLSRSSEIRSLKGKGDYRQILVSWEYPAKSWFILHYCEIQAWGSSRCKSMTVDSGSGVEVNGSMEYTVLLEGLRMATNYSISVDPGRRTRRLSRGTTIIVPTKGFSARAVSCLPEVSEVEVETGPHFSGRIGVESGRCSIEGDPNSRQEKYLLRIHHAECGSQVNDTSVSTFVLVQESSHILTHSTRRFLVLCTFQPETLTVRAGLNLPQTADGMVEESLNDISENEVHASPLRTVDLQNSNDTDVSSLLGGVAALLGLIAVGLALWRYLPRHNNIYGEEETGGTYDNLNDSATDLGSDKKQKVNRNENSEVIANAKETGNNQESSVHGQLESAFI